MPCRFKSRLASGEKLFGTMVTLTSPATAEILADIGFDWLFIDGEHGPLETSDIAGILRAVGDRVACVVRVPIAGEVPIKKVLDLGATGIIVPQVNSVDQARDVVRWSKYAPLGARGVGLGRAHRYGLQFAEYIETANEQTVVIVQAEHAEAVEQIEEIVRVPGIDAIQLGPYDLSASMGKMGQIEDPEVVAAIERIYAASRSTDLPVGCFGVSVGAVQADIQRGSTLICAGTDTLFLAGAAKRMLAAVKG